MKNKCQMPVSVAYIALILSFLGIGILIGTSVSNFIQTEYGPTFEVSDIVCKEKVIGSKFIGYNNTYCEQIKSAFCYGNYGVGSSYVCATEEDLEEYPCDSLKCTYNNLYENLFDEGYCRVTILKVDYVEEHLIYEDIRGIGCSRVKINNSDFPYELSIKFLEDNEDIVCASRLVKKDKCVEYKLNNYTIEIK